MKYSKRSLGQNFLIDKNIIKKIINLSHIENNNILEIGPGRGSLTKEILNRKPKSLILIEKDNNLYNSLKEEYKANKKVKIYCEDFLKFKIENIKDKDIIVYGNLPYNISSQILIKFLKLKNLDKNFKELNFMFQKELGEKIMGKFPSLHYGRLSIIRDYKLKILKKFLVSNNCFSPKPAVKSMVIKFKPRNMNGKKIKNISNLEKVTNILFSNKRKMINKGLRKILPDAKIGLISDVKLDQRPEDIKPEIYYKITELYEQR